MKKIAFIIIMLLSASLIPAQNISELEQLGYGHIAEITQIGDSYSSIIQGHYQYDAHSPIIGSVNSIAKVNQNGDSYSSIIQVPRHYFATMYNAAAEVTQIGFNNSFITQDASETKAFVYQDGFNNHSDITQRGNGLETAKGSAVYLNQIGRDNTFEAFLNDIGTGSILAHIDQIGKKNETLIHQQGRSTLNISQTGDRNSVSATITSYSEEGTVNITQIGNDNVSDASLYVPDGGSPNELFLSQTGSGNYSRQHYLIGASQKAEVIQIGNNNYAVQDWYFPFLWGDGNEAHILQVQDNATAEQYQGGNGNYAEIKQWAYRDPKYGDYNIQRQAGNNNKAMAHTYGGENAGWQYQEGDDNWMYMKTAGSYNSIYAEQNGNGNSAFEETLNNITATHNGLSIFQWEDYNQAEISIEGEYNTARIRQSGNSNIAYEETLGFDEALGDALSENNYLSIVQNGDNNQGYISVKGTNNTAAINQEGSGNIAGTSQSDFGILQDGWNNNAEINQYGDNNEASIIQKGSSLNAVVNQSN